MKPTRFDDIASNLSVKIFKSILVKQNPDWHEKKIKTVYTIWSITRGNVWIKINNKEFYVNEGGTVLFYPNDQYSAYTDQDGCEFVYTFFSLEMGGGLDLLSSMNLAGIIPSQDICNTTSNFCRQFTNQYTPTQQISLKTYTIFISYLCDIIEKLRNNIGIRFYDTQKHYIDSTFSLLLDYISINYQTDISVKQLAKLVNLSEKRFISKFNYIVGMPPGQYVAHCRMRKATELLITTEMSMSEIAQALGYSTQYAFSKAFKRIIGESPSEFRKMNVK